MLKEGDRVYCYDSTADQILPAVFKRHGVARRGCDTAWILFDGRDREELCALSDLQRTRGLQEGDRVMVMKAYHSLNFCGEVTEIGHYGVCVYDHDSNCGMYFGESEVMQLPYPKEA